MREDWAGQSPECWPGSCPRAATDSWGEGCRMPGQDAAYDAPHMDQRDCSLGWRTTATRTTNNNGGEK